MIVEQIVTKPIIAPQALVDERAKLAAGVKIGPFSVIGPDVEIGEGTWVGPHVVINGPTKIGKHNRFFQFASIGEDPQDKKYQLGEPSRLEIGDYNVFREGVTVSRGTHLGGDVTKIGHHNLLMAYVHIAHDCLVGNQNVFSNNASLAGHVQVYNCVNLGGFVGVHQFSHIGSYSFCAAGSLIGKDIPPFIIVSGYPLQPYGLNSEGLKRRAFSNNDITVLKRAYKTLYRENLTLEQALEKLESLVTECQYVQELVDFIKQSTRGIIR